MSDTHDGNPHGSPNTTSYTRSFLNSLQNTPENLANHARNVISASPVGTIQGAKIAHPSYIVLYIKGNNGVEKTVELNKNSTEYHNLLEYCGAYPESDDTFPPNTDELVGEQLWQGVVSGEYAIPNRVTLSGIYMYKLRGSLNTFLGKVGCVPWGVPHAILMVLSILQFITPSILISVALIVNLIFFMMNIIFRKSPWRLEKLNQELEQETS
jgi:hypothetical protein